MHRPAGRLIARLALAAIGCAVACARADGAAPPHPARNVILFVADGLRRGSVNATDAPTFLKVRSEGVDFPNSHALFPTFTTANASAIATSHQLGDTGDFGNTIYLGFPIFGDGRIAGRAAGTPAPFLESDAVLADLAGHFPRGNYLGERSLLALARAQGFATAAIGKLGPVAIQDVTELAPVVGAIPARETVFIDDSTGVPGAGIALSAPIQAALAGAGLPLAAPPREQPAGSVSSAGTVLANTAQQRYFADAATRAVLPAFVASGRPFVLVFWSRDPDGSQHNQGDSLNRLVPGINGPTSRAGVANADANLRQLLDYVAADPRLAASTDVFVTSDHGFATLSRHEIDAAGHGSTAYATRFTYLGPDNDPARPDVVPGWLPPGFLAIDLAQRLALPLYDPDTQVTDPGAPGTPGTPGTPRYQRVDPAQPNGTHSRQRPAAGNGLIGGSGEVRAKPDARVVVTANGGSDLIYVPGHDRTLVRTLVEFLLRQDYVGGLFVDSAFGRIAGALPLGSIGLEGAALTPRPAIVVAFRSFASDPSDPLQSAVQVADTPLQEGQGMHGSLSRDNTLNNMAAIGPDFKRGYVDRAPVGNADIARTLASILGLRLPGTGRLPGRLLRETLVHGPADPPARHHAVSAAPAGTGAGPRTVLELQSAEGVRYLDRACLTSAPRCD